MPKINNPYIVSTSTQFIPKIFLKMGDMADDVTRVKLADPDRSCKTSSKKQPDLEKCRQSNRLSTLRQQPTAPLSRFPNHQPAGSAHAGEGRTSTTDLPDLHGGRSKNQAEISPFQNWF
jgi:hypothetical protein